jgi:hypothetical protein
MTRILRASSFSRFVFFAFAHIFHDSNSNGGVLSTQTPYARDFSFFSFKYASEPSWDKTLEGSWAGLENHHKNQPDIVYSCVLFNSSIIFWSKALTKHFHSCPSPNC